MYKYSVCILSGGHSSRMSVDKGMTLLSNHPMITYGMKLLEQYSDDCMLSANSIDYKKFSWINVTDVYKECGPMGGLFSTLIRACYHQIIVLSCDMPFVPKELIDDMIHEYKGEKAMVVKLNDQVQPLCGIYSKDALITIEENLTKGKLKMLTLLDELDANFYSPSKDIVDRHPLLFFNVNTKDSLLEAEKYLKNIR